jgi:hypothetical protein
LTKAPAIKSLRAGRLVDLLLETQQISGLSKQAVGHAVHSAIEREAVH